MTAQSEYGHYMRFDAATYVAGEQPFDTGLARVMVNDVRHLQQVHGQVLVDWVARTSSQHLEPTTASTTAFEFIGSSGLVPIRIREDGSAYTFVVGLGGKSQQGHNVTLRVVIGVITMLAGEVALGVTGLEGSTTSLTSAWLATTDVDTAAASTVIELHPSTVPELARDLMMPDGVASTEYVTRRWALADVQVWGLTSNVLSKPRLSGLYVREFRG